MAPVPPSLWFRGYKPTQEDYQHISDEAIAWAEANAALPGQLPATVQGSIPISSGVLLLPVPAIVAATQGVLRIDLRGVVQAQPGDLYMRVSTDGSVTFLQDSTQYQGLLTTETGPNTVSNDHFPITGPNVVVAHPSWGWVDVDFGASSFRFDIGSGVTISRGNGWWTTTAPVTHLLIGSVRSTLTAGVARLSVVAF